MVIKKSIGIGGLLWELKKEYIALKLRKIIFTHQDIDHIGSASEILKERYNNIKMISFQEEKPYIEGTKKPVKLSMLEQSLDYLPEKMNMFYDKLKICFWKI